MFHEASVYTIGHSTHTFEGFVTLLTRWHISAVADVRSTPYSRWQPQFTRESLKPQLRQLGIAYVFLGAELGGRGAENSVFDENGRVQYHRIAESPPFREGIRRVQAGRTRMRLALMCTERDPIECHRGLLVSRTLMAEGTNVVHIHADGQGETHRQAERRLRRLVGLHEADLFRTDEQLLNEAYERQEAQVAYIKPHVNASRSAQL
jgi:uncharacterized protein (DUF488 family)